MTQWTSDELSRIDSADELDIAPMRSDGTLYKPVTIWVVRAGDDLYVRSYRADRGAWYRHALLRLEGQIQSGDIKKDVTFAEETDPAINDRIDNAYRTKYSRYGLQYVNTMLTPEVRATTLKLVPRH